MPDHNIDIPSGRIRYALEALREFESRGDTRVDMYVFRGHMDGVCVACLGGAARIKSENQPIPLSQGFIDVVVNDFEDSISYANFGNIELMFKRMGIGSLVGKKFNRHVRKYAFDPANYYADMNKLADDLESAGY